MDRTGSGAAVERQREDCLRLAAERGWTVERVWTDNDVSASSGKTRPEYSRMLAAIERGEVDVVLAWHVDRLTRSLVDLEALIPLAERTGVKVATVTGDLDLSTDTGRLLGRILASVARGEVERKGTRQRRAQQQAAEQGRPAGGRRAFGYASNGIDVVEDEAVLVKAAYADVLAGASLKGLAARWNAAGHVTSMGGEWRRDNLRSMLLNPRYAGLRTYRGEVVGPAVWPALVDEDTHAAAVALLSAPERRTTTTTARKYLLPGIALCWKCGSDVATGHTRHGKRVYVCRQSKCISRKAEPVDEYIDEVMIQRLSRPDAADLLVRHDAPDLDGLRARAAELRRRRDDLADLLADGVLSLAKVRQASERLSAELASIEAAMHDSVKADALTPLLTADDVAAAWHAADLAQRREVIAALMTITLLRPERGHQQFDPSMVAIAWKA